MKVLFVTNLATHYRKPLFSRLNDELTIHFVLFSDGREWYWKGRTEPIVEFPTTELRGLWIGRTRLTPGLIAVLLRRPFDVVVKDIDGRFALPITYLGARLRRKPFVLWTSLWRHPDTLFHRLTKPVVGALYKRADAIVTYGHHVSEHVIREGARPERVFIAPQAIDLALFSVPVPVEQQQDFVRGLDEPILLYVGRLETWKGPQLLLESIDQLKNQGVRISCVLAGEGSLRSQLEDFVREHSLSDRVRFLGAVPNDELPALYQASHALVIPSIETKEWSEPWSLAVNEAMASGTPVIASDAVGAVRDGLLRHGETGLVFHQTDVADLVGQISDLLRNPDRAEQMATLARRSIQSYSFEAAAQGFVDAVHAAADLGAT